MATRFYPSTAAAAAAPAFSPAWDVTTGATRAALKTTADGTTEAPFVTETSTAIVNLLGRQFVSVGTIPSARTLGVGTFSAVLRQRVDSSLANAYMQIVVKVVSGDGSTVRGYLHGGATANTTVSTVGAQNETISNSTFYYSRIWNAVALSPVDAQAGDRIVVEIGARATNTSASAYAWSGQYGANFNGTDLALTSGITPNANAWVEFSEDLFGVTPGSASGTLAGTLPKLTGSISGNLPSAPNPATLAGTLRPLIGSFAGTVPAAPGTPVETATTYANDGYDYDGTAEVDYEPPVAPTPARVRRADLRRVHQSVSTPTLVDGRPV